MKKVILIASITILLGGCSSNGIEKEYVDGVLMVHNPEHGLWQDATEPPISFELEQTFGVENEPAEERFSYIASVITDNNGNVYLFDVSENRLVAFEPNGNLLWTTGRQGQGPGDFYNIAGMAYDGYNSLYISNSAGMQIDRYDIAGNYQSSYLFQHYDINRAEIDGFIAPDICVLHSINPAHDSLDIFFTTIQDSLEVNTLSVEKEVDPQNPDTRGLGVNVGVLGDEVVVTGVKKYELKYFNSNGELVKVITRDFHKLVRPFLSRTEYGILLSYFGGLGVPLKLQQGYQICVITWPSNGSDPEELLEQPEIKYQNSIDLFNTEGELLYSLVEDGYYPEIGNPVHVDHEGNLYTTAYESFPQVRRYAVRINK